MAHRIYHTKGIILRSADIGESNKFLFIFTEELGRIGAMVQGVRALSSKLRFVLQDYSYVHLDLVRGRSLWRVTSAQAVSLPETIRMQNHRKVTARICSLLHRLAPEEEQLGALWDEVQGGLRFLHTAELEPQEVRAFEIVMVMKILHHLGYWGTHESFVDILNTQTWSHEVLGSIQPLAPQALVEIRNALTHSHL